MQAAFVKAYRALGRFRLVVGVAGLFSGAILTIGAGSVLGLRRTPSDRPPRQQLVDL